ncbi:CBO0543 family protein [Sporomusa aerivorans]|uniref:CBO0543 family protein n=1 Tax=Sporomusa aerivorans TaxID=204936 RepID=UPI00352ABF3A
MLLAVTGMPLESEMQKLLTSTHIENWLREDAFQLKWWFLLSLSILAVICWWKLLDKTRLPEITLYAVLTTIIIMGIDEYGAELILWDYPIYLFPIFPAIAAINLALFPMIFSLVYQHFTTWRSYIRASLMSAALLSFIIEPSLSYGNFYQLINWKYYYSFLLYIAVALLIKGLLVKVYALAGKA